jgi:hypothetical protein
MIGPLWVLNLNRNIVDKFPDFVKSTQCAPDLLNRPRYTDDIRW